MASKCIPLLTPLTLEISLIESLTVVCISNSSPATSYCGSSTTWHGVLDGERSLVNNMD